MEAGDEKQKVFDRLTAAGQGHLVEHYSEIGDAALQATYLQQLEKLDLELASTLYQEVYKKPNPKLECKFAELENFITLEQAREQVQELTQLGLEAVAKGEVGLCLMSGGQGTRLGFDHPKGMFKIGLQSGITLFEFFSKRLQALANLAHARFPDHAFKAIPWYIMTSEMNHKEIEQFFESNSFFGYDKTSVVFFPQGGLPALDYEGRIIIEAEGKISLAPGGNGAIYYEMKRHGVIDDLKKRQVKYLHIGGIDNILLKVADPTCLGYLIKGGYEIVSKFVNKRSPQEKVGLHVLNNGKVEVCEYSEMPEQYKSERTEQGELRFRHSFMATYFVTTEFLDRITSDQQALAAFNSKYHLAEKKIAIYDRQQKKTVPATKNTGIKFELFCFDCFDQAKTFGLFQIDREEEFAPVKNATGEDSPQSARLLISRLHYKWLSKHLKIAGEPNSSDKLCELASHLSYDGEDLEKVLEAYRDKELELPLLIK